MANLVPTTLGKLPGTMSNSVFRLEEQDRRLVEDIAPVFASVSCSFSPKSFQVRGNRNIDI